MNPTLPLTPDFRRLAFLAICVLFAGAFPVISRGQHKTESPSELRPGITKLDCDDEPCAAIARGRVAFFDRNLHQLGGNGRSCADCHMPSEGFQLSPAATRARFDALQEKLEHNKNADDPLFRPVDADDFRVNGESAIDYSNLLDNGLIRVTMPLPLNVKLIDPVTGQPSDETSVDLWRAVMPIPNAAITGPDFILPM